VPIAARGLIDQAKIATAIQEVEEALAPDVVRIMHSYRLDWAGSESLFFKIVLSDAASSPKNLRETTQHIIATTLQGIKADELGLQTYFNFRSKSEQDMLREPSWDRP
jgi:hypothetical protein